MASNTNESVVLKIAGKQTRRHDRHGNPRSICPRMS